MFDFLQCCSTQEAQKGSRQGLISIGQSPQHNRVGWNKARGEKTNIRQVQLQRALKQNQSQKSARNNSFNPEQPKSVRSIRDQTHEPRKILYDIVKINVSPLQFQMPRSKIFQDQNRQRMPVSSRLPPRAPQTQRDSLKINFIPSSTNLAPVQPPLQLPSLALIPSLVLPHSPEKSTKTRMETSTSRSTQPLKRSLCQSGQKVGFKHTESICSSSDAQSSEFSLVIEAGDSLFLSHLAPSNPTDQLPPPRHSRRVTCPPA